MNNFAYFVGKKLESTKKSKKNKIILVCIKVKLTNALDKDYLHEENCD